MKQIMQKRLRQKLHNLYSSHGKLPNDKFYKLSSSFKSNNQAEAKSSTEFEQILDKEICTKIANEEALKNYPMDNLPKERTVIDKSVKWNELFKNRDNFEYKIKSPLVEPTSYKTFIFDINNVL